MRSIIQLAVLALPRSGRGASVPDDTDDEIRGRSPRRPSSRHVHRGYPITPVSRSATLNVNGATIAPVACQKVADSRRVSAVNTYLPARTERRHVTPRNPSCDLCIARNSQNGTIRRDSRWVEGQLVYDTLSGVP